MPLDAHALRQRLEKFDFSGIFTQELGWDFPGANLTVNLDDHDIELRAVAEKHGLAVYQCEAPVGWDGDAFSYPERRKIERQVAKSVHEHLIIFTDAARTAQTWQWVKREIGRPDACREQSWHRGHSGERLIQRLQALFVSLEDEENITLVDVAGRVRTAFDVERVTKRFYDRFKEEHKTYLSFIEGIQTQGDREWYASLMLNRTMFIYFIQKKGFLDGDPDYLRNRLRKIQDEHPGSFYNFYRLFLLKLFHQGLGQQEQDRAPELAALLGKVPYLDGGLFDVHELERENTGIQIKDEAFERIFGFFDSYDWHLDERPLREDREINPDVLGYIFEKYINQSRWAPTTPRRTSPDTSAATRSFLGYSTRRARITQKPLRRIAPYGNCSEKTRIATFTTQ